LFLQGSFLFVWRNSLKNTLKFPPRTATGELTHGRKKQSELISWATYPKLDVAVWLEAMKEGK
jgi:hypothetical protein